MKKINIKQNLSFIITAIFIASFGFFVYANDSFNRAVFNDSDQDGLSDEEEKTYGTDPENKDTDNDGYSDGVEIKSGYNPLKPAPGDKIVPEKNLLENASSLSENARISTEKFSSDLKSFLEENTDESLTLNNLDNFVTEKIGAEIEKSQEKFSLTETDIEKIKIKEQNYSNLTEAEAKEMNRRDVSIYLSSMAEILANNSPRQIITFDDVTILYQETSQKIEDLTSTNPDYDYFRTLGNNIETAYEEIQTVEVPESFLNMHIDFLSLLRGYMSLQDPDMPSIEDSMGKLIIYSKAMTLGDATADFVKNFLNAVVEL
ncbi:MAG: hypothetical protein ACD_11C00116G0040 [uncultured bacterium]|nr:MAG: hypothetical protein ACD_11C00116G0040 [uncultured bacterium]HBR71217.1 hypothetical protein [Candidatus Moranbacteria bacterium]